jgi:N,N'-diacetyllegionaminate synthase
MTLSPSFTVGGHTIGPGSPCFVIAEAGVNHNGSLEMALRLVDVAADCGADAVKFQTFRADALTTADAPKAAYQHAGTSAHDSQQAMLRALELSESDHRALQVRCAERNILFLSTPFDEACGDLLEGLDLPAFKLPSGELTNLPFLAHMARKGRPLILSTGMATLEEVRSAVDTVRRHGAPPFALLHCLSNYPADPREANLRAMHTLEREFQVPVGYSDHTPGHAIAWAAVAMGACILEKHFTLDRTLPGPDHRASLEVDELKALIEGIRLVEAALGDGIKRPSPTEADTARVARKSLVVASRLEKGHVLSTQDLRMKRPGTGLPATALDQVLGRTLTRALEPDHLLAWDDLA